jgi:hypothetical protein
LEEIVQNPSDNTVNNVLGQDLDYYVHENNVIVNIKASEDVTQIKANRFANKLIFLQVDDIPNTYSVNLIDLADNMNQKLQKLEKFNIDSQ